MAYDFDPDLFGTIMGHIREIDGMQASLEAWDMILWGKVYDNCEAVSRGGKPDLLVQTAYIENKTALAKLQGDSTEVKRLETLRYEIFGTGDSGALTERRG